MEKTNRTLSEIAIIGSISTATLNASSFFLRSIVPHLSQFYRITIFTNERNPSPQSQSLYGAEEILHIHQLPEYFVRKKYKAILYSIENSTESFLYRWYAAHYPGIVLLQDKNLFRLEFDSLRYGTDGRDLNALMRRHHGNDAIPIGDQHVRGRSLEIYAELYPCIELLVSESVGIGFFSPLEDVTFSFPRTSKPVFTMRRPLERSDDLLLNSEVSLKPEYTLLVIIDSPFSRSAQEILSRNEVVSSTLHFPLSYSITVSARNYDIIDSTFLPSNPELESEVWNSDAGDAIVILGQRPHSSIKSQCFNGFLNGAYVSSENLGEFTALPSSFFLSHSREDSFRKILQDLFSENQVSKCSHDNSEEYRLHDPVEVVRGLYKNIESIYHESSPLSFNKSEKRKKHLSYIYERINSSYDKFSHDFSLMSQFIETEKSRIFSHYNDLFGVG